MSPYVRKTAVMSCVKLHLYHPGALADSDIVNTLYTMLRDRDPQATPPSPRAKRPPAPPPPALRSSSRAPTSSRTICR